MRDDPCFARTRRLHLNQFTAPLAGDLLDHSTGIIVIHINRDLFNRLQADTIFLAEQNARAGDRQFEPFAAHVLDQNTHLQFAAPGNFKRITARRVRHLDRNVRLRFLEQAIPDDAALHFLTVTPCKRAVVDAKSHRDRRRINRLGGQGRFNARIDNRIGNRRFGHASNRDDIARFGNLDGLLGQSAKGQNF